jgi:hypothetical protein
MNSQILHVPKQREMSSACVYKYYQGHRSCKNITRGIVAVKTRSILPINTGWQLHYSLKTYFPTSPRLSHESEQKQSSITKLDHDVKFDDEMHFVNT